MYFLMHKRGIGAHVSTTANFSDILETLAISIVKRHKNQLAGLGLTLQTELEATSTLKTFFGGNNNRDLTQLDPVSMYVSTPKAAGVEHDIDALLRLSVARGILKTRAKHLSETRGMEILWPTPRATAHYLKGDDGTIGSYEPLLKPLDVCEYVAVDLVYNALQEFFKEQDRMWMEDGVAGGPRRWSSTMDGVIRDAAKKFAMLDNIDAQLNELLMFQHAVVGFMLLRDEDRADLKWTPSAGVTDCVNLRLLAYFAREKFAAERLTDHDKSPNGYIYDSMAVHHLPAATITNLPSDYSQLSMDAEKMNRIQSAFLAATTQSLLITKIDAGTYVQRYSKLGYAGVGRLTVATKPMPADFFMRYESQFDVNGVCIHPTKNNGAQDITVDGAARAFLGYEAPRLWLPEIVHMTASGPALTVFTRNIAKGSEHNTALLDSRQGGNGPARVKPTKFDDYFKAQEMIFHLLPEDVRPEAYIKVTVDDETMERKGEGVALSTNFYGIGREEVVALAMCAAAYDTQRGTFALLHLPTVADMRYSSHVMFNNIRVDRSGNGFTTSPELVLQMLPEYKGSDTWLNDGNTAVMPKKAGYTYNLPSILEPADVLMKPIIGARTVNCRLDLQHTFNIPRKAVMMPILHVARVYQAYMIQKFIYALSAQFGVDSDQLGHIGISRLSKIIHDASLSRLTLSLPPGLRMEHQAYAKEITWLTISLLYHLFNQIIPVDVHFVHTGELILKLAGNMDGGDNG